MERIVELRTGGRCMLRGALAASLLLGVGCGEAPSEPMGQSALGLGSTKPQSTIGTWTALTQIVSDGNYGVAAGAFAGSMSGGTVTRSHRATTS